MPSATRRVCGESASSDSAGIKFFAAGVAGACATRHVAAAANKACRCASNPAASSSPSNGSSRTCA